MAFFNKESSRPLPELLDGDDWEARNSGDLKKAYVDFQKREFVVPFHSGPAGELVRAHEAMHVKITPHKVNFGEDDFVTYQAVEDSRVNQGLRLTGIQTDKGRVYSRRELEDCFRDEERRTPLRLAESFFSLRGLAEEGDIREVIESFRPEVLPIAEEVYDKYFGKPGEATELTPFEDVPKCIKELKDRLKEVETEQDRANDEEGKCTGSQKAKKKVTASFVPGSSDKSSEAEAELDVITKEEAEEIKGAIPFRAIDPLWNNAKPGKMHIHTPKLDGVIKFKKVSGVKLSPSDEGVIPSRMHRYTTDQKVFTRKGRRRVNAAVIIDVSGSMSLTDEQIEKIIRLSPASIIATYSGSGVQGGLQIVAQKGRFTRQYKGKNMGGANVVDVPALEWLAARKEKVKIWISDGIITGENDHGLDAIYIRKSVNLIRKHKIIRVPNVKRLIEEGILIDSHFESQHEIDERMKARVM